MSEVYICHTVYHVYITCIKVLVSPKKVDLVLCDTIPNCDILKTKIMETNLFEKVIVIEHYKNFGKKTRNSFHLTYFYILLNRKKIDQKLNFLLLFDNVFIYTDYSNLGAYLLIKRRQYHLIEDGFNMFKEFDVYRFHGKQLFFKKVLYELFNIPYCIGIVSNIIDIEVNDDANLKTNIGLPVLKVPRNELVKKLNEYALYKILYIFDMQICFEENRKKLLLITQPLTETGIVKNLEEQIAYYKAALKPYYYEYDVYIKPHPRDNVDYISLLENGASKILDKNSPVEILDFHKDVRFDLALTYSSTSIKSLHCCNNVKILKVI
ncbi:MAG: polysialyltransferase family glycosyltransferase [Bacteroidales bacterium]